MDLGTLRKVVEEAVRNADTLRLWSLIVAFLGVGIAGFIGSYAGAYLQAKGRNLATKEDFQELLDQNKKTTQATEEIRNQIQRRFSFQDKILWERYSLIKDINYRLETVRIGYDRLKKGLPTRIEIINGETLLLTELQADLQLHRSILTPTFYDLLSKRYDLVCVLWQHKDNDAEWSNQIKLWCSFNDEIQKKMEKVFPFPSEDQPFFG